MNPDKLCNNIGKCPHSDKCNQNLCPLDIDLPLRKGGIGDKCRWMRPPIEKTVPGGTFISGGRVMPDGLLKYVPESNFEWLNTPSQKRWLELKKNETKS